MYQYELNSIIALEYDSYTPQSSLQVLELALLDDQMTVVTQVFYNVIMSVFVILEDDSLDGGITLDEDTCCELAMLQLHLGSASLKTFDGSRHLANGY